MSRSSRFFAVQMSIVPERSARCGDLSVSDTPQTLPLKSLRAREAPSIMNHRGRYAMAVRDPHSHIIKAGSRAGAPYRHFARAGGFNAIAARSVQAAFGFHCDRRRLRGRNVSIELAPGAGLMAASSALTSTKAS